MPRSLSLSFSLSLSLSLSLSEDDPNIWCGFGSQLTGRPKGEQTPYSTRVSRESMHTLDSCD
ncbi:hypothetical protein CSHISOI_06861 [Colletotrichum shisoi]|uniref:Secreted protein n=1 Tax=Colletotrichum shisoi TaxID=2078593 RepID=A0A5Q4BNM5_9PEZI|nr:hypothetical protein CSHISOI_06861 [Colletotrichum shisoi]